VTDEAQEHGMTRRQLLRHTAWFGSAVVLTVVGGEVISQISDSPGTAAAAANDPRALRFVQISDSHIGFTGPANTMVEQSFTEAIDQVNALPYRPAFVMHTGDLTHLSTPAQFDQVKQMLGGLHTDHVYTVPGEHDGTDDHGANYRQFFGRGTLGDGWFSFDLGGVHFISLVNTLGLESMGHLGVDQLEWMRKDVAGLSSDTPIVVFSHIPLFAMYAKWGWSTDDSVQALSYLRRFASVTCLNGHVHQLFTKTEGNITLFSATTTAYPLPKPGDGPAPSPVTLPARQLHAALGIREVNYVKGGNQGLAIKDRRLA